MAAETTVQIKQEPLDAFYAAEMGEYDAGAATTSSSRSTDDSVAEFDRRACDISSIGGDATKFPTNVTIKVEPDIYTYTEGVNVGGEDFNAHEVLGEAGKLMLNGVQVKAEPVDDFLYPTDCFDKPEHHSQATTADEQSPSCLAVDLQVVDEHDNIITVNAADLSPQSYELAFMQKLHDLNKSIQHPFRNRRSQKCITCKLCMKRCFQDTHYSHHMNQHQNNRIFCVRKTCDTWFGTLEDCERHEYEVHEIRQLKCNVCNHKFQFFDQLSQHKIKMHSKLLRFVCSICRDWFISLSELQEHWTSLPDGCGRLAYIQNETSLQILKLLKQKEQKPKHNSYKIKCASNLVPPGLKLKLKPTLAKSSAQPDAVKQNKAVEIKQEPLDYEAILPDFPVMNSNTKPIDSYEILEPTPALNQNGLAPPPVKLRLRKQPMSTPTSETEKPTSSLKKQTNSHALGHALAQRITSKFALKTVPKMFHMTNKANEANAQTAVPPTSPDSLLKRKWNATQADTVPTKDESPAKMLKLPSNFKIVKMLPMPKPPFVQMLSANNSPAVLPHATTNNPQSLLPQPTNAEKIAQDLQVQLALAQAGLSNRHFTLQEVEVPSLDKSVVAAKIESVTKANKELSLTELLQEAIVREEPITDNALATKKVNEQEIVEIKAEEIKKELDEEAVALKLNDALCGASFSDNSMGSSSNATTQNTISEDGVLELPKRSHSPHITRNNCRSKPKPNPDGYICPKCGRRYSTRSMVREHLRNNCGRNPQHECDVCHKFFFSGSTLNCHRTIHTGVLPHKCQYCDKRFRTRGQVTVHHRTHTGERPFVCEICSQSFTHRETLISHLSRHIGMKRYKCYGCNKQFSCISGLSMHRATRPDTCGQFELNTRAIGPRVRVIRGRVVFEPQPADGDDEINSRGVNTGGDAPITEVLMEIQNK